jgi:TonB family protein
MILRLIAVFLWGCALAQIQPSSPTNLHIRVSDRVTNKLADQKVLPDISDLKGKDLDSLVVLQIVVNPEGAVKFSKIQEGNAELAQRSLDAAQKWHHKPYIVNGQAVNVDTWIRFKYTKDNVEAFLPEK